MEWIKTLKDQHFPDQTSSVSEFAQEARRTGVHTIVFRTRELIEDLMLLLQQGLNSTPPQFC